MKYLLFVFLLINTPIMAQDKLPFESIPEASDSYDSGNIIVRMIEGLGYRYYWATKGLTTTDLDYKPSSSGSSTQETLQHIHGLVEVILNVSVNKVSFRPIENQPKGLIELRSETLNSLKQATLNFKNKTPEQLSELNVIFERGGKQSHFPLWNLINGPLSDAIYHTGQVVSFRRSAGNPIQKGVNVFMGKTKE
ncbi:hypothetical protein N9W60_05045 [Flavobacteriaceae bacterium]|nr:hypothetical protein [Flavobacteriaceae bacterium]MDB4609117.1 hypothetical protein [Flavobacteriaceae bacterium]